MEIKITGTVSQDGLQLQLPELDCKIEITAKEPLEKEANGILLLFREQQLLSIEEVAKTDLTQKYDRVLMITLPETLPAQRLVSIFQTVVKSPEKAFSTAHLETATEKEAVRYAEKLYMVIENLGYIFTFSKEEKIQKNQKPRHRWSKALSQVPFNVTYQGTKATIFWQKRNELLIQAGAQLLEEMPLNKDGTVGFSARLGEKLRQDHQGIIQDFKTTQDLILKSVNEAGLLLYFGGTNSWLQMKDKDGKTIDEWSKVDH